MPRYVILRHERLENGQPSFHWDLMLEAAGALKTWALAELPSAASPIEARQLPDHRLAYLDYEGPISGDRGTVARWDRGIYEIVEESPAQWVVELCGEQLQGRATLHRSSESELWAFSRQSEGL